MFLDNMQNVSTAHMYTYLLPYGNGSNEKLSSKRTRNSLISSMIVSNPDCLLFQWRNGYNAAGWNKGNRHATVCKWTTSPSVPAFRQTPPTVHPADALGNRSKRRIQRLVDHAVGRFGIQHPAKLHGSTRITADARIITRKGHIHNQCTAWLHTRVAT